MSGYRLLLRLLRRIWSGIRALLGIPAGCGDRLIWDTGVLWDSGWKWK